MPVSPRDEPASIGLAGELVVYTALLVFVSAIWFESDAYRYVALVSLIPATIYYFWVDFRSDDKVLIGYMGLTCIGWASYIFVRLLYNYVMYPEGGTGSAEGIYLFPMLYTITGYALFLAVRRPFIPVAAFVLISFLAVLYSVDPAAVVEGRRADVVLHANPIHMAVAQGMIVLCMLPFASYLLRTGGIHSKLRSSMTVIAIATLFVALVNVYALKSKGVWLALAVALPVQFLYMTTIHGARRRLVVPIGLVAIAVAVIVSFAWHGIWAATDDTALAIGELWSEVTGSAGVARGVEHMIHDEAVPGGVRERLMLWASAMLIWVENPIFGKGVAWLSDWQTRVYPDADYSLLHNGYLEIAIRYGVMGLAFYVLLFAWTVRQVWRAKREGIIDPAAFNAYAAVLLFFAITILSNSNVRLAIGEAFMWFSAAFGFYCYYRRQQEGRIKVTTWI